MATVMLRRIPQGNPVAARGNVDVDNTDGHTHVDVDNTDGHTHVNVP